MRRYHRDNTKYFDEDNALTKMACFCKKVFEPSVDDIRFSFERTPDNSSRKTSLIYVFALIAIFRSHSYLTISDLYLARAACAYWRFFGSTKCLAACALAGHTAVLIFEAAGVVLCSIVSRSRRRSELSGLPRPHPYRISPYMSANRKLDCRVCSEFWVVRDPTEAMSRLPGNLATSRLCDLYVVYETD
jgi:hypothetical protein